jgi:hypothetical protein
MPTQWSAVPGQPEGVMELLMGSCAIEVQAETAEQHKIGRRKLLSADPQERVCMLIWVSSPPMAIQTHGASFIGF